MKINQSCIAMIRRHFNPSKIKNEAYCSQVLTYQCTSYRKAGYYAVS